ncbi:ABC transporter permease [Sphingosinicella rhizophila]|uniref:ABC transporter permease subunit n=1 Tax=Sphingosinicella rhizophila TaxID=3050082 RepID=A0ABU3Q5V2_9SPHN|nr:ABC transporter permease subunit [Sphingosinicella sp. GR2756]MDT9598682.1 ABC transporter permease subunit [Sphingosinicella sp. GR2756]
MKLLLRRLLVGVPTLLAVITLTFFMMRAAPGGPFDSERKLAPDVLLQLEQKYGLDRPIGHQYLNYLGGVMQGDLGPSLRYKSKSVRDIIADGLPVSATIGGFALLIATLAGILFGVYGGVRRRGITSTLVGAVSTLGICVPTFVVAPLLVLLFGSRLGWFPTGGINAGWRSYVLPSLVLALPHLAFIARLTRVGMIEVMSSNYVRTARARGLSEARIITRHALRGAILPVVSYLGPACAGLLAGSLVVEQIFALPGLGRNFVLGALQRDYTVVMGVVIFYAVLIILFNLLADMLQAALDPRVAR